MSIKKRYKSVLAMVLAASMLFGMNTSAYADTSASANTGETAAAETSAGISGQTAAEQASDSTSDNTVSDNTKDMRSEDNTASADSISPDTADDVNMENAGKADPNAVSVKAKGTEVSYNGQYATISVDNISGYSFYYKVSSNVSSPDYGTVSQPFTPASSVSVNVKDAGQYSVSIDAVSKNGFVSGNAVVIISINKALIKISTPSAKKIFDLTPLTSASFNMVSGNWYESSVSSNITVNGTQTNAGSSKNTVSYDMAKMKNYDISVSAGELTVVSANIVITSISYKKHYDGKAVSENCRKGFTVSSPDSNMDMAAFKSKAGLSNNDFTWDPASSVSQPGVYQNKFKLNTEGLKKLGLSADYASISLVPGNITITKFDRTFSANELSAPSKLNVKMTNRNWIQITWSPVTTYTPAAVSGVRMKKITEYHLYRYEPETESWNYIGKAMRGRKFTDKEAGALAGGSYIYKVCAYGYDQKNVLGEGACTYKMCAPLSLTAASRQNETSIDYQITAIKGADAYVFEHADKNKAASYQAYPSARVSANKVSENMYTGSRVVSANSFKNNGALKIKNVKNPVAAVFCTDSQLITNSFKYYRSKAVADIIDYTVSDAGVPVTVSSDYSAVMRGRCTIDAPVALSASTCRYNEATVVFEKMPLVDVSNQGGSCKYQIFRSTRPDAGYSCVKTITGRQLYAYKNNANNALGKCLVEIAKGKTVTIDGVKYTASMDCYAVSMNNLSPERTYYYKVRAVYNNVAGPLGNSVNVTPRMTDVLAISANNRTYNQLSVSVGYVLGAKSFNIYYRAVKHPDGTAVLSTNAADRNIWQWKKKNVAVKYDKTKTWSKAAIGGLYTNYTYEFYALPVNGREHVTSADKLKKATQIVKLTKPAISAKGITLTSIRFGWKAVPGASWYVVHITDTVTGTTSEKKYKLPGSHVLYGLGGAAIDKKSSTNSLVVGRKYKFEIQAFRKDKANPTGTSSDMSNPVIEYGRPVAPTSPKAVYNTGKYRDAKLSWTKSTDATTKTKIYYEIVREIYKYKSGNTFASKTSSSVVLLSRANKYEGTSFAITENDNSQGFAKGDKVVYKIYSVYKSSDTTLGESGNIVSVKPVTVNYINPYSIKLTGNSQVTVGSSIQLGVEYTPSSTTNKAVRWTQDAGSSAYFTLASDGKVTGVKSTGTITYNVYATAVNGDVVASKSIQVTAVATPAKGNLKVCIDPGHGGSDSGATYNGMLEKNCNLDIANAVNSELNKYGVSTVMTRTTDTYVSLENRTLIAKNNSCNLFVSIHCNSTGGTPYGSGTEVYYSITSYSNSGLASKIASYVSSAFGITNRGYMTRTGDNGDYYSVIRTSAAKGITGMIVENAFMDGDYSKLSQSAYRSAAGKACADAILETYGYK